MLTGLGVEASSEQQHCSIAGRALSQPHLQRHDGTIHQNEGVLQSRKVLATRAQELNALYNSGCDATICASSGQVVTSLDILGKASLNVATCGSKQRHPEVCARTC